MRFFNSFIITDIISSGRAVIDKKGKMPNIEFPTLGGRVFWKVLADNDGWQLQKNFFTGHCRILDSNNIRKAWGSEQSMWAEFFEIFDRQIDHRVTKKFKYDSVESDKV